MNKLDKNQKLVSLIGGIVIIVTTAIASVMGVQLNAEKTGNLAATTTLQESLAACRTTNNSLKEKIIEVRADPTLLEQIFRGLATQ